MNKPANIDEYITTFPENVRTCLEQIRSTVHAAAPGAVETIKYDMPTVMLNGKNLVFFAAFKRHIGFYGVPTDDEAFKEDFSAYKTGSGSIQFPLDKPMPLDLIKRIVSYRIEQTSKS